MDWPNSRVHGTAIATDGAAALILGASGAGKSDLALRCLALPPGPFNPAPVCLIADDQVLVTRNGDRLTVAAPPQIAGKIEVRGIGIIDAPTCNVADLVVVIDLVPCEQNGTPIARLPDPWPRHTLLGVDVPVLRLRPFEASAPLKVLIAIAQWRRAPSM